MRSARQRATSPLFPDLAALAAMVAIGLAASFLQTRARVRNRLDPASELSQTLVRPAANLFGALHDTLGVAVASVFRGPALMDENQRWRAERSLHASAEERVADLEAQVAALEAQIGMAQLARRTRLGARVIGYGASDGRLTLDKGRRDGVAPGYAVVGGGGLLGTVQTVSENRCTALALTSPSLKVGVVTAPPARVGLLQGAGAGDAVVTFFDARAPVRTGERLVTSGFSGLIPRGLPVGVIDRIEKDEAYGVTRAIVRPSGAIGETTTVTILR